MCGWVVGDGEGVEGYWGCGRWFMKCINFEGNVFINIFYLIICCNIFLYFFFGVE